MSVRCSPAVDAGELSEGFALLAGQLAAEVGSDAGLSQAQLRLEMVPAYFHCDCGFDGQLGPDDFAGHIGICPVCGRVGEVDAGVEVVAMSFADTEPRAQLIPEPNRSLTPNRGFGPNRAFRP